MQLVLATRNAGKKHEFEDLLRGAGIQLRTLDEFPEADDPDETGATFEENALIKARAAAETTGLWALADDSGLCVDALEGRPGIHSARYAKGADDARWKKLLGELAHVADPQRTARFRCVLALASPGGQTHVVDGTCEGRITREPRGAHGFGYDPLFLVAPSFTQTGAELPPAEKNRLSHRAAAAGQMAAKIQSLLATDPAALGNDRA